MGLSNVYDTPPPKNMEQAEAELGQAQVKLDDIVEVVVDVEVIGVVKVEV